MAADPEKVVFTADTRFLWAIEGERGLYASTVAFPKAGRWGVRFTAAFPDGRREQVRADFDVAATGSTPAIGAAAVSVDTPTASDVGGDLAKVSTDKAPNPAFYATLGRRRPRGEGSVRPRVRHARLLPDGDLRADARQRQGGRGRLPDAHVHQRGALQDGG